MVYEMRRIKPEPTFLLTQQIFNVPRHIGMVWEELAFDDALSYTQRGNRLQQQLNAMVVMGFAPLSLGSPTQCFNQLSYLPTLNSKPATANGTGGYNHVCYILTLSEGVREVGGSNPMLLKFTYLLIITFRRLTRCLTVKGMGKNCLAENHNNVSEWDIGSWCQWGGLIVGRQYEITMCAHCYKSVSILIWTLDVARM